MFFMCTHKQQLIPMRFLSSAKIVYIRITIDNIRRRLGKTNSKKVIFCFAMHPPFTIFT